MCADRRRRDGREGQQSGDHGMEGEAEEDLKRDREMK